MTNLNENNIDFNFNLKIGCPKKYSPNQNILNWAKKNKVGFRSNIKIFKDKLITSDENNNLFYFNKKNGDVYKLIPTEDTLVKNQFINNIAINNNITLFLNTYGSLYAINNETMKIL